MKLESQECLVVEDASADIEAAKAGGMSSLAVGPLYQQLGGTFATWDLVHITDWDALLAYVPDGQ